MKFTKILEKEAIRIMPGDVVTCTCLLLVSTLVQWSLSSSALVCRSSIVGSGTGYLATIAGLILGATGTIHNHYYTCNGHVR